MKTYKSKVKDNVFRQYSIRNTCDVLFLLQCYGKTSFVFIFLLNLSYFIEGKFIEKMVVIPSQVNMFCALSLNKIPRLSFYK